MAPSSDETTDSTSLPSDFLLTSACDSVDEVFVVDNELTAPVVAQLAKIIPLTGAKLTRFPHTSVPHDVWIQDTVEFGVVCAREKGQIHQTTASLLGIRALHDGIKTEPLDRAMAEYLQKRTDILPIRAAVARPHTRWIDWFGNLEVTPPISGHPNGRVLIGRQKELAMHPDILAFLEKQKRQWPPIEVDVSWLTIGHVDEVVNFIPANDALGFRVLMPSPTSAMHLLKGAVDAGQGNVVVFAGKADQETTVAQLYTAAKESRERVAIEADLAKTKQMLLRELSVPETAILELPVLYKEGLAITPNAVNCLVVNGHVVIPHQSGPVIGNLDLFDTAIAAILSPYVTVHFVDIWQPYHVRSGEIHCGTNAIRRKKNPVW